MKKVLEFIKKNVFMIILYIVLIGLLISEFVELDYSVYAPGGLVNINDRLENKPYESKGSFNMTYVTYRKGTLFNLMIAKLLPSQDIVKNDDITLKNEDINDSLTRSDIMMKESISLATYTAYTKANKELKETGLHLYVYYIYEDATTELKVGDEIKKCDGKDINSNDELKACITAHEINDEVELVVNRKNKEVTTKSTVKEDKLIRIIFVNVYDYEKNPNIEYKVDKGELGSSGGLILTLSIYNALIEEDITKGMKIAGTGTIEADGSVGEISGIKYKIKGAAKNKVDLFIVPEANYEEAEQVIRDNKLNVKLLKAKTFDQVLEDLKNYN